jgi:DNA-binding response OmpR family regulator
MKATILLISYYPGLRDSLNHALRWVGYDVTLASNGHEGVKALRKTGFDLVLLDLDLPPGSAWGTLCRMVTNTLSLPVILSFSSPVLILTGRSDQQFLVTQKGVAAVYEKPVHLPWLLDGMKRALVETAQARRPRIETGHISSAPSSARGRATIAKGSS